MNKKMLFSAVLLIMSATIVKANFGTHYIDGGVVTYNDFPDLGETTIAQTMFRPNSSFNNPVDIWATNGNGYTERNSCYSKYKDCYASARVYPQYLEKHAHGYWINYGIGIQSIEATY